MSPKEIEQFYIPIQVQNKLYSHGINLIKSEAKADEMQTRKGSEGIPRAPSKRLETNTRC